MGRTQQRILSGSGTRVVIGTGDRRVGHGKAKQPLCEHGLTGPENSGGQFEDR